MHLQQDQAYSMFFLNETMTFPLIVLFQLKPQLQLGIPEI